MCLTALIFSACSWRDNNSDYYGYVRNEKYERRFKEKILCVSCINAFQKSYIGQVCKATN